MLNITGSRADRTSCSDNPSNDTHCNFSNRHKNPYVVLSRVSRWTILSYHLQATLIGIWVLFKWLFQFVWMLIHQYSLKSPKRMVTQEHNYRHDKPPPCLVDNRIGLQSYVKLKGTKLHYIEAGNQNDPLVLLLHGFPDCWLGWHYQIKELSRFFRVVALDLKGFNDSDKPIWRKEYTPHKICDELFQFMMSLGSNSMVIIGHDIGAVIGWIFAHSYPDHIDRFISISASHPNLMWDNLQAKSIINDQFLRFVQLPYLPETEMTRNDSSFIETALSHLNKDTISKSLRYSMNDNLNCIPNKMDAYKYVFSRKMDWFGPLNYFRNLPFYKIRPGEMVQCPCLIVIGSEDKFCRLDSIVRSTEYCENYVVKIIENAAHWPHQEMPLEMNRVILKFLVGHRANPDIEAIDKSQARGIMGRMLGAVSNSYKIGSYMLDSVQQRTSALH